MTHDRALRAPYAPLKNVRAVIHRMRDRGLPNEIDTDTLATIGIAEGNQPRTLAALKFLGLVTEGNRQAPEFERIGRASNEEYAGVLEEILREAYAPVLQIVHPAEDDFNKIDDAFRQYVPSAQRSRMVALFIGLCVDAGIAPEGIAPEPKRAPTQTPAHRRTPRARQGGSDGPSGSSPRTGVDLRAIHAWVDQLPTSGRWSDHLRSRWLNAVTAAVDFAIEVGETEQSAEGEEGAGIDNEE